MANKNITMRQKNTAGSYDKLYPKTTATQSKLSAETAALYGDGVTDADAAMRIVANTIKDLGFATVIVKDPNGNPIQGAIITGIQGSPTTDANGKASGVLQSATISVRSPYVDLQSKDITISGSFSAVEVTLPTVGENAIKRFTSSQSIKFSNVIKTVDICCVGGGGGGGKLITKGEYRYEGGGGGGGGIVNSYSQTPTYNTPYNIVIGGGGSAGYTAGKGGTTTFMSVSANGGGGAYVSGGSDPRGYGGTEGSTGSGRGGGYDGSVGSNTTLSEFNDGVTFYSGGGGSGYRKGGAPNGADGAYITGGYPGTSTPHSASTPGIGGGGGGATFDNQIDADLPSSGGPGLVAIRFHFS